MAAPEENTLPREDEEIEEMEAGDSDEDEMEEEGQEEEAGESEVYVPGVKPLQPGEELEMDHSAYRMYHECQTGGSIPTSQIFTFCPTSYYLIQPSFDKVCRVCLGLRVFICRIVVFHAIIV